MPYSSPLYSGIKVSLKVSPVCLIGTGTCLRLCVSTDVGFASSVTSASEGKWQIPETVSSIDEIVEGSVKLGVPWKVYI